jgi:hypothetical protein
MRCIVRFTNSTSSASVSNLDEEEHEIELIPLTPAIEHRRMMAEFGNANLQLVPVSVKKVFPCSRCKAPVVLARLGRETKLLDAWENPYSPRYWARWETDPVLSEHHCGCLQ